MIRSAAVLLLVLSVVRCAFGQEQPKGPFARGEKLPGDLSELLDGDENGQVSDAEVKLAIEQFTKEANAREKTERGKMILDALDANADGKLDPAEAAQGAVRGRMQQGGNSEAVAQVFKRLDVNSDNFISAQEYGKLQVIVGLLKPEAARDLGDLFEVLDTDRDRAISFVESQLAADLFALEGGGLEGFGGGARPAAEQPAVNPKIRAYVDATFAKRDRNKDGQITEAEAKRDAALKREFAAADANADKSLSPTEMADYLQRKLAAQPQSR
jgi:Ca2+-binding EF-hand superfamily protein